MPVPAPPRPVMSSAVLGRIVVMGAIVVIMLAVAVIALKVGVRDDPKMSATAQQGSQGTQAGPAPSDTAPSSAPSTDAPPPASARIQAPVTTAAPKPSGKAPKTPQIPRDPADLGVLVNKDHGLEPTSYAPKDLRTVNGQQLRSDAADALKKLIDAAASQGHDLRLLSGYRSAAEQDSLRQSYVQRYGVDYANTISAPAGFSEHQTGLAADVGNGRCDLEKCFGETSAGRWVAKNAHLYGFTVRYPLGQEASTGYAYEPWHLRYLGKDLSKDLDKSKAKTLEDYYGVKP